MHLEPHFFFKMLADQTRLRCLSLVIQEGELCVCELTEALGISQPKISRHLAQLRTSGILSDRRQGQWVFYRLEPGLPGWARTVLRELEAIGQSEPYRTDRIRLAAMANRPESLCCD